MPRAPMFGLISGGLLLLWVYRALGWVLTLPVLALLLLRRRRGKEHPTRWRERLGGSDRSNPADTRVIWVHAVSVGEANSALPLLAALRQDRPGWRVVLTTGTVGAARALDGRLPEGVIHQFAPVDLPWAVDRFLARWRPHLAFWIESELWPGMILTAARRGVRLVLVNGRMSAGSHRAWQRWPWLVRALLRRFDGVLAQSEADAARLADFTPDVVTLGNLKHLAEAPACPPTELEQARSRIGTRPVWLAASVHPGELPALLAAHRAVRARHPQALLILAPRHPDKADQFLAQIATQADAQMDSPPPQRSRGQLPDPANPLYLADSLGELGLWYRLAQAVFIGGSLIPHGGQNPAEAADLGLPILFGPSMDNFPGVADRLVAVGGARQVADGADAGAILADWLADPALAHRIGGAAAAERAAWRQSAQGLLARLISLVPPDA